MNFARQQPRKSYARDFLVRSAYINVFEIYVQHTSNLQETDISTCRTLCTRWDSTHLTHTAEHD